MLGLAVLWDGICRERPVPRRGYLSGDDGACAVGGAVAIEPVDAVLVRQKDVQALVLSFTQAVLLPTGVVTAWSRWHLTMWTATMYRPRTPLR